MKIDKSKLKELSALNDAELWKKIREIAKGHGINLPESVPPAEEMAKLRSLMLSDTINPLMAMRVLSKIKKGER